MPIERSVNAAWRQRDFVVYFVLNAIMLDKPGAKDTLQAFGEKGIGIEDGLSPGNIELHGIY